MVKNTAKKKYSVNKKYSIKVNSVKNLPFAPHPHLPISCLPA